MGPMNIRTNNQDVGHHQPSSNPFIIYHLMVKSVHQYYYDMCCVKLQVERALTEATNSIQYIQYSLMPGYFQLRANMTIQNMSIPLGNMVGKISITLKL